MKVRLAFGAVLVCIVLLAFGGVALAQTGAGWFIVSDDLWVKDATRIDGDLYNGTGAFTITDDIAMSGVIINTSGAMSVTDDVNITGTLNADGAVTFNSTLDVDGNVSSGTGAFTITDDIAVTGSIADTNSAVTIADDLTLSGVIVNSSGAVTVSDDLVLTGTIVNSSGAVTVTDSIYQAINQENIGMLPTVASAVITYGMTGASLNIFTVAANEVWVVHDILVNVTSNFNCTGDNCTLIIGDSNDTDGFITLDDGQLQAADTEGTGFAAGWQGMNSGTRGIYLDGDADDGTYHPFVYAAAETIDFAVGGTDPAAGAATVYIWYTRLQ